MKHKFFILFLFYVPFLYGQKVWYVDQNAPLSGNGNSWNTAFENLQDAIDASSIDDHIWMANGIYIPSNSGNRNHHYLINKSLKIYGGFVGNEKSLSERNITNSQTILSGEINNPLSNKDNSNRILHIEGSLNLYVNELTFEGAYGDLEHESNFNFNGLGAILADNSGTSQTISFENCSFRKNYASRLGGVFNFYDSSSSESSVSFIGCDFSENVASENGSIFNMDFSAPFSQFKLTDCLFTKNDPDKRGNSYFRVQFRGSDNHLSFDNIRLEENSMITRTALFTLNFGGYTDFYFKNSQLLNNKELGQLLVLSIASGKGSTVAFSNLTIKDNDTFDPPIRISSSAFGQNLPKVSFENIEISNHINGETWHLIDLKEVDLVKFDNNKFLNNWAGPLNVNPLSGDIIISNCLVAHNEFRANDFSNQFNFINTNNHDISFVNCTFAHNAGRKGSIVRTQFNKDNTTPGNINFSNCIFFDNFDFDFELPNPDRLVFTRNSNINFSHCLFEQGDCAELVTIERSGSLSCDENSLFLSDPHFVGDDNYYLAFCSPGIDAGKNDAVDTIKTDLSNNERILNGTVDIGSYENTPTGRFIGFSCSDGIVYSDWLSGIDQGAEFEFVNDGIHGIIDQMSRFVLKSNGSCIDTLSFPVSPITGVQFSHEGAYSFNSGLERIEIEIIEFVDEDFDYYVFPEIPFTVSQNKSSITFSPEFEGTYYLAAVNENGCYHVDSIFVEISDKSQLFFVANVFSPNNDGYNDELLVEFVGDEEVQIQEVQIFDRSGNVVHSLNNQNFKRKTKLWNGLSNDNHLSVGLYVYVMKVILRGEIILLNGDILLMK